MTGDLHERVIREIAYFKWQQAGCPVGDGLNFWLEAEQEYCDQETCQASINDFIEDRQSSRTICEPPPLLLAKVKANSRKKAG